MFVFRMQGLALAFGIDFVTEFQEVKDLSEPQKKRAHEHNHCKKRNCDCKIQWHRE